MIRAGTRCRLVRVLMCRPMACVGTYGQGCPVLRKNTYLMLFEGDFLTHLGPFTVVIVRRPAFVRELWSSAYGCATADRFCNIQLTSCAESERRQFPNPFVGSRARITDGRQTNRGTGDHRLRGRQHSPDSARNGHRFRPGHDQSDGIDELQNSETRSSSTPIFRWIHID